MSKSLPQANEYTWKKVLLWAFLFYVVWNWKGMMLVFTQGVLPGPDDFMRLHQVQNWFAGQAWYDLKAYRMAPPLGADIHWSRLIDAPIAALIGIFHLFMDLTSASRMAAIVWPLAIFLMATAAIIAICDHLAGKEHRLLALFFFVLSINTLAEFRPGRLDHHNVQILLLILIFLGVARGLGKYSSYWLGLFISCSIMVGLDSLLLIIGVLGFLALEWLFQKEGAADRLLQTGFAISISSIFLYVASFPADRWFSNNACDAFSMFYLSFLVLLSASFTGLAILSKSNLFHGQSALIYRLFAGAVLAAGILIVLFSIFPHCLDGPYGNVGDELKRRWLDKILEAKGIVQRYPENPMYWLSQAAYLLIMITVTALVVFRKVTQKSELAILGFVVVICILGAFYQTRILRTGIYSVIPFCVIFAGMTWHWLESKFSDKKILAYTCQALLCLLLTSTLWVTIGTAASLLVSNENNAVQQEKTESAQAEEIIACTSDLAVAELKSVDQSHIMSDLNTAPALLVHTRHSVEAGSYHRNGDNILNVIKFFEGSLDQAKQIADDREANFVVICREDIPVKKIDDELTLATAIGTNQLPTWLSWVSTPNASLAILKVAH